MNFQCPECGGNVSRMTGSNRSGYFGDDKYHIPDEILLLTCDKCEARYINGDDVEMLDNLGKVASRTPCKP